MRRALPFLFVLISMAFGPPRAAASLAVGSLCNFDTLNDTGQEGHGFEIEIEDVRSTAITYTYDWNHYGAPTITEDLSDPAHPKVRIRYESGKDASGSWTAYTAMAAPTMTPPTGHACTNPAVNEGCEHFGVGYYGATTRVSYHWLVDDGAGNLVRFPTPVSVSAPSWAYVPPAPAQPAQVVAEIPAPPEPIPAGKEFGEPIFLKVVKTTSHNSNPVALGDLISDDVDGDGLAEWQNHEPDEVETEWKLLQTNLAGNAAKEALEGAADDMGDGSEKVTRRYEFYEYGAAADTLDGETGEAMCDEVNTTTDPTDPMYRHGVGTAVSVTDPFGETYYVNCEAQVVVGEYIGAQMAGFDAESGLGLIDNLQDGESGVAYTPRTVVVGGDTPFAIAITQGSLPGGMEIGEYVDPVSGLLAEGVLSGTPTEAGLFAFTVEVTDASDTVVSGEYTLRVAGSVELVVGKLGSGSGTVSGNGIDCGVTCSVGLDPGTDVTLTATPDAASAFTGWSGACAGTGECSFVLDASSTVYATFEARWPLTVSRDGSGTGTVQGGGIDCGATCTATHDDGAIVTLTATPDADSTFAGWSGAGCSGTDPCTLTMDGAKDVVATFDLATHALSVSKSGTGTGVVTSSPSGISCGTTCSAPFTAGALVTLTATADVGSKFAGWSGAGCSGTGSCMVTMDAAKSVTASFATKPCGAVESGSGSVAALILWMLTMVTIRGRRTRTAKG